MPVGPSHRHSQVFMRKEVKEKGFYRRVLAIAVPILIHNAITNFVSLLDNIMVGQVGTTQMSGVSICNQLFLVFNLCIFGAVSGAGIFTAQFYGSRDMEGYATPSGISSIAVCSWRFWASAFSFCGVLS